MRSRAPRLALWSSVALCLAACPPAPTPDREGTPTPDPDDPPTLYPTFDIGDEVTCAEPYAGLDRFEEVGPERGLSEAAFTEEEYDAYMSIGEGITFERAVVVEDVDLDGTLDLLIARQDGLPTVFLNDGQANFVAAEAMPPADPDLTVDLWGVADIDGDALPDLVGNRHRGGGFFARNLGGGRFEEAQPIDLTPPDGGPMPAAAIALGDLDSDGDVDAVIVSVHYRDDDAFSPPDPVLENVDGELTLAGWIDLGGFSVSSQASAVLDVGWDGEPDLFHFDDTGPFGPGSAIFTGFAAGPANVVDRAADLSADVSMVAMGLAAGDLNRDGLMDYCASDIGAPVCLVGTVDGPFVESGLALGLVPIEDAYPEIRTIGWSMEFADFDNDGLLDVFHASGEDRDARADGHTELPDLVWHGRSSGGFEEVGRAPGDEQHGQPLRVGHRRSGRRRLGGRRHRGPDHTPDALHEPMRTGRLGRHRLPRTGGRGVRDRGARGGAGRPDDLPTTGRRAASVRPRPLPPALRPGASPRDRPADGAVVRRRGHRGRGRADQPPHLGRPPDRGGGAAVAPTKLSPPARGTATCSLRVRRPAPNRAPPGRHPGLLIRVSGYSAYFDNLSDEMKQEIIDRTLFEGGGA